MKFLIEKLEFQIKLKIKEDHKKEYKQDVKNIEEDEYNEEE